MSRYVQADEQGGPEVLSVVESEAPTPAAGEVAVAVRAAAVNPIDTKVRSGLMGQRPGPIRFGFEIAGVVTAVGEGVAGFAPGDEVIAHRVDGGYASDVVVPVDTLIAKPANLPFEEASGLLLTGVTAAHTLVAAGVGEGDTVLVHGASGGVGQMAVQLAVGRGARVIGTASPANHELLRELGAEPVSYGAGLADRVRGLAPDGVDTALDLVGSAEALEVSLELVEDRDRIVTIANFADGPAAGIKVLGGGPGADPGTEIRRAARQQIVDLAASGDLVVTVTATFPLEEAGEAHRLSESGRAAGKIILVP